MISLKPGQVKKPLILSVGMGLVASGLSAFSDYYLRADPKLYLSGDSGRWEMHQFLSYGAVILGLLVFPAIIAYTARRFYFLWSLIPGMVTLAAEQTLVLFRYGIHVPLLQGRVLFLIVGIALRVFVVAFLCGLISSGPVSLVRYILQRRRGLANTPEDIAPVETVGNGAAWPPPPAVK